MSRRVVPPTRHNRAANTEARAARQRSGPADRVLWEVLNAWRRERRANFERSYAVGGVIADFIERDLKLAVLLAPGTVASGPVAPRRRALEAAGYTVVLVPEEEVISEPARTRALIEAALPAPPSRRPTR